MSLFLFLLVILLCGCRPPMGGSLLPILGPPLGHLAPLSPGFVLFGSQVFSPGIVLLCGFPFLLVYLHMIGFFCIPQGPWHVPYVIKVWKRMIIYFLIVLTLALFGRGSSTRWDWRFPSPLGIISLFGQGIRGRKTYRGTSYPEFA